MLCTGYDRRKTLARLLMVHADTHHETPTFVGNSSRSRHISTAPNKCEDRPPLSHCLFRQSCALVLNLRTEYVGKQPIAPIVTLESDAP